jgi:hypothetical protein
MAGGGFPACYARANPNNIEDLVVEGPALKCSRSWLHWVRGHESGYSLSIFVTIKGIARLRRTAKPPNGAQSLA